INLSLSGLTTSQASFFTQAQSFWESVLIGYKPGINIPGITINAAGAAIDGVGGTLGQAGPAFVTNQGGFTLTTEGNMTFDSADLANLETNGSLEDVILHEMAHVLGFGTLWTANSVYVNGSGQYTGTNGLAMWQTEFNQPGATFVPVELGGSAGTANGHWDENNGGAGLTGVTDGSGNDMRNELMTGWLNTPAFISNTTKMSFMDIGYDVAIVPLPAAMWLFASGSGVFFGIAFRRSQSPG
ncbi:MAG: peptidase, partial [Gammaproteobacteria bacterium]|nr:peptidase [Gammaproteobacteria bacterium]